MTSKSGNHRAGGMYTRSMNTMTRKHDAHCKRATTFVYVIEKEMKSKFKVGATLFSCSYLQR